jgi:DNA-directed RNA polymerase subunit K/omega
MEKTPNGNRFEFVAIASARARQLLRGALPREAGEKVIAIAQREVISRKVEKVEKVEEEKVEEEEEEEEEN